ncbi:hypothetical protein Vretimale_18192 [Volvox reticuliferus]|uniref:Phosducin domain-containing protein n=1 Tax=Volvox reticuliferus TaxID=1737510 RepID=A0A8J4CWM0_9CHLO|nr:hypothetical protein Vretifemale_17964 [Volvox reticuliferus]GIM15420.1 hypothetical protein Vretimale_18192 [Volvox reticuliferus]
MEDSSRGCCPSKEEKDAADAARFGLPDPRELQDDPVLAGCCEEDLQNMRRAEALRTALLAADRSATRLKLQQQALHTLPPPPQQQQQQQQQQHLNKDDFDDLDVDDDDAVLLDLRQRRLAELQRQAAERQQQLTCGYGRVHDLAPGALLERLEALEAPGAAAVTHLAVAGCEVGALLDEHLTCLAHRYPGTFFVRVAVKRGEPLAARLGVEGLPALVCFRAGALVGRAPVSQFGPPGCLVEEEVTSYLRRLHVLREAPGVHDTNTQDEDQEEEEEWKLKPCDLCGRRYPHEHVRAVYSTCHRRSSDGSGDDDVQ